MSLIEFFENPALNATELFRPTILFEVCIAHDKPVLDENWEDIKTETRQIRLIISQVVRAVSNRLMNKVNRIGKKRILPNSHAVEGHDRPYIALATIQIDLPYNVSAELMADVVMEELFDHDLRCTHIAVYERRNPDAEYIETGRYIWNWKEIDEELSKAHKASSAN